MSMTYEKLKEEKVVIPLKKRKKKRKALIA